MNILVGAAIVGIYLAGAVVTYTGSCGYWDWKGQTRWRLTEDVKAANLDMRFSAIFAVVPPLWISAFLFDDFYAHGFRWSVRATPEAIQWDKDNSI